MIRGIGWQCRSITAVITKAIQPIIGLASFGRSLPAGKKPEFVGINWIAPTTLVLALLFRHTYIRWLGKVFATPWC
jgi:hypothetical protein